MSVINGTSGADLLNGTSGADAIYGVGGNDTLNGGDGDDRLYGGAGADVLNGGNGYDWADYSTSTSAVTIDLNTGALSSGDAVGDTYNGIESYVGSGYNDTFIAGTTATTFDGGNGGTDDVVNYAGATAGITLTLSYNGTVVQGPVSGGGGIADGDRFWNIDRVIGTAYNDLYILDSTAAAQFKVTEAVGGGIDEVRTVAESYTLGANIENLTHTGTSNFTGIGNALANVITGSSGSDSLIGGVGADTLVGGDGFDWASYAQSGSALTIDLYDGSRSTGEAAGDVYSGIESYVGSYFSDTFIAGATATTFDGTGGSPDTVDYSLSGSGITLTFTYNAAGNVAVGTGIGGLALGDRFYAITRIVGTAHDDTYVVNQPNFAMTFVEGANGGLDTVVTSNIDFTLGANIENLTHTGGVNFTGIGNALNNVMTGSTGNDALLGGLGADTLIGGDGYDWASYAQSGSALTIDLNDGSQSTGEAAGDVYSGIESYIGSYFSDTFVAGATSTTFDGTGGSADTVDYSLSPTGITLTFSYNSGANVVTAVGSGGFAAGDGLFNITRVIGTSHDDTYVVNEGLFALTFIEAAGGGNDTVLTNQSSYTIGANIENLGYSLSGTFTGTGNGLANVLTGGAGTDTLNGLDGNDTLLGGGSGDVLNGGNGFDTASYANAGVAVTLNFKTNSFTGDASGDAYNSIEKYLGSSYNDTFVSGSTAHAFDGGGGFDTVNYATSSAAVNVDLTAGTGSGGDAAGDTLANIEQVIGSAYADTLASAHAGDMLVGGAGDDIYAIGSSGVSITESAGGGTDEVRTSLSSFALTTYSNVEQLTYTGAGNFAGSGDAGNNTLTGGTGDDTLAGGAGADLLNGGGGTDAADYSGSSAAVAVDLTAGTASGGDAAGDTFSSIEMVIGSTYADTLSSATAGTILAGGAGEDVYVVGSSAVAVVEAAGGGTDEVQTALSSLSIAGFANVEKLTFTGTGSFTGTGNSGDNVLIGGSGNDTLIGGAGSDQLIGNGGADTASYGNATAGVTIDLKSGASTGDAAGDTYSSIERYQGSSFSDTFISSAAAETFDGAGGTDTVNYAGSVSAVVVNLTSGAASGGDAAGDSLISIEKVIGSAFADTLAASSSGKTLVGGDGDDLYIVGSSGVTITEAAGGGTDTVQTGLATLSIATFVNVENLTYTGTGNFAGTGNAGDNILTGGGGNDTLVGGGGADQLIGGGGTDTASYASASTGVTIDLKTGANTGDAASDTYDGIEAFKGSTHNDIFIAGSAGEAFDGNGGVDTVNYASSGSAVTVDLTGGTGSGGDATGDSYTNVQHVIGSAFDDTLGSATAGHVLQGGAGNDIYQIGDAGVVVTELAGGGTDEVRTALSSVSIAGYANVENLTYTGSGNFAGVGNGGDNILTGGDGSDTLAGGAGADHLVGGDGIDTADYSAAGAAVAVDLSAGSGSAGDAAGDTLTSIERVVGSAFDDTLSAAGSNDTLEGDGGDDRLAIGGGTASGGDGNDMLVGNSPLAVLLGGNGGDILTLLFGGEAYGGEGDDIYHLEAMAGSSAVIRDDGVSALDKVFLPFLSSTSFDQTQVGDDLYLSDGTTTLDLKGWFAGYNTIEQFETTNGEQFSL